jgi:uncharacterized protein (TIGR02145 family)
MTQKQIAIWMKKKNRNMLYPSILIGLIFVFLFGCKKDKDTAEYYGNTTAMFNPNKTYGTVDDIEGNSYRTIQIGTQIWMAENLKTTKYNDDAKIPNIKDNKLWGKLTSPAYCWFNNDEVANKATYGALYNCYTINSDKLCPSGWHIPSDAEWDSLTFYLDGQSRAGSKLKETNTAHWQSPNDDATNESGFTGLPGGYRDFDGPFYFMDTIGFWWASTGNASNYYLRYNSSYILHADYTKSAGFSVRCIKD